MVEPVLLALSRPAAATVLPVPRNACWPPGARAVAALRPGGCRWPVGEVEAAAFRFCNEPSRHRSYCDAHRRLAHAPVAR